MYRISVCFVFPFSKDVHSAGFQDTFEVRPSSRFFFSRGIASSHITPLTSPRDTAGNKHTQSHCILIIVFTHCINAQKKCLRTMKLPIVLLVCSLTVRSLAPASVLIETQTEGILLGYTYIFKCSYILTSLDRSPSH